ncbi:MAG: hypothetical protein O7C59_03675 [Rickettsia endosymbiont of Ixodes persulcatus]|nr:hypothetical protein [Rickettsia endosymbiont of Ixodes persulcatus]
MDDFGVVHMVDVMVKDATKWTVVVMGVLHIRVDVVEMIVMGGLFKGDALVTVRIVGILGVKRISDLILLCH